MRRQYTKQWLLVEYETMRLALGTRSAIYTAKNTIDSSNASISTIRTRYMISFAHYHKSDIVSLSLGRIQKVEGASCIPLRSTCTKDFCYSAKASILFTNSTTMHKRLRLDCAAVSVPR